MDERRPIPETTHADASDPNPADEQDDPAPDLVAYLDGELEHTEVEAIEGKISLDATVRAEVETLKKTWDLLDYLPRQEPSPHFTERTISHLDPLIKSAVPTAPTLVGAGKSSVTPEIVRASATEPVVPPQRLPRRRFVAVAGWLLVFGLAGCAGYFIHALIANRFLGPLDQQEKDAKILSDRRLLQNMRLYRHVDDLEFLKNLDQPELFGDEQSAPISEGPK